jgi:hypothetical protein
VIEQIPLTDWYWEYGANIDAAQLQLSFNRNENIDTKYKVTCIQEHNKFFEGIKEKSACFIKMDRKTKEEILSDFSKSEVQDSIIYFYCHAQNGHSRNDTYIEMTYPDNILTLADLENYAKGHNLSKEPLVFINTCESAANINGGLRDDIGAKSGFRT